MIDTNQTFLYTQSNLADGTAFRHRTTIVFQKQQDDWKIVQWHSSTGVPNADVLGKDLTTE